MGNTVSTWVAPWQRGAEDGASFHWYVQAKHVDRPTLKPLGWPHQVAEADAHSVYPTNPEYRQEYILGFLAGYKEASR